MTTPQDASDAERDFAIEVLRKLLLRIDAQRGVDVQVSHAWVDDATIHMVYTAPPSDITWGLVRDTRVSLIDGAPWADVDEAELYYYLLDFEENWPGNFSRQAGEPDDIRWVGDLRADLPTNRSGIPAQSMVVPSEPSSSWTGDRVVRASEPGATRIRVSHRVGSPRDAVRLRRSRRMS